MVKVRTFPEFTLNDRSYVISSSGSLGFIEQLLSSQQYEYLLVGIFIFPPSKEISGGLVDLLSSSVSSLSSAATSTNDSESVSSYSKQITNYLVVYSDRDVPPSTHYYNVGGWTGTLSLDRWQSTGTEILAYYSGTVNCSGPCVMTKSPDNE
ncbi:hypothetical protein J2Z83_002115 [Virgibacillus natechei]|uniref:Uncharacterized protein n=1 Tax=Virgibacillus natechei TaxID=1216297 RepID=A0ABS4IGD6_9BACI|nr:hypothetical protein [Virgibacillus natechei]